MEEQNDAGSGGERRLFDGSAHWWWAMGSGAQIMWGVRCIRRGYAGDMSLMPLKAFGVASLFVGAIATTSVAFLSASGIHTVQDAIELGENIRTNLGIHPQIPGKQITGRRCIMNNFELDTLYRIHGETLTEQLCDRFLIKNRICASCGQI